MLDTSLTATAHVTEKSLLRGFSYINGKWCAARSGDVFAVTDPASGNRLARWPSFQQRKVLPPSMRHRRPLRRGP
jgi:hypothetical protein